MPRRNSNAGRRSSRGPGRVQGWPAIAPSDPIESISDVKTGVSTGTIVQSPQRQRRDAARRRREEARWASLSGPVIVRRLQPVEDAGQPRIYAWGTNT